MSISTSDLEYPVLRLQNMVNVEACADEDSLTTATQYELKKKFKEGMVIVDSIGRTYYVREAKCVGGKGAYRGYYGIFAGRIIRISLEIDYSVDQYPLHKLKAMVVKHVRKWRFYESDTLQGRIGLKSLEEANTFRDLIGACLPVLDVRSYYEILKPSLKRPEDH